MKFSATLLVILYIAATCTALCPSPNITQKLSSAWNNGENDWYSLWEVSITNTGDEALLSISLDFSTDLYQYWEIVKSSDGYVLPEWRKADGIPAGQTHSFGYIAQGVAEPNVTVNSYYCTPPARASLFHVSTLQALSDGLLTGVYSVGRLLKHGDFGLGTYQGYNGEMIVLDGHCYHAYANGTVLEADDSELTPFAAVVNFTAGSSYNLTSTYTEAELNTFIASIIPSDNYFYAIKIHGVYSTVTTRAIPLQSEPYPTLTEAMEVQVLFNQENVQGTSVVLRSPPYVANLNAVGDHFHFISDDHLYGGHVTNLTLTSGTLEVQQIRQFKVWLPNTEAFQDADLSA